MGEHDPAGAEHRHVLDRGGVTMLAAFRMMFKRAANGLPAEVAAAIDAARIMPRTYDEDEGHRVAVALGGRLVGAFIFSQDEAQRRIRARWPDLTDAQVGRAVAYLASRVRLAAEPVRREGRTPWVLRY